MSLYNQESQAYPYEVGTPNITGGYFWTAGCSLLEQNIFSIVANQISIHGFRVGALASKWAESYHREVPRLIKEGKLKVKEDRSYGLESVGEAFLHISTGGNKGKKVIIVAED